MLNDTFRQGIETSYGTHAGEIYGAYQALFAALPLAVRTPNRVFLCHTIPDPFAIDRLDLGVFEADEWSEECDAARRDRLCDDVGRNTDPEIVDRFAAMVDADLFVTGHQPCDEGFRQANHRQLIIDGTDPYPTYCLFPARDPITIETLLAGVRVRPIV